MKAYERDCWKNGCQMSEENLKIPASGRRVESHLRGARQEVEAFDVVTPETMSHSKPRNRNRWAGTRQDFVVDDETHLEVRILQIDQSCPIAVAKRATASRTVSIRKWGASRNVLFNHG